MTAKSVLLRPQCLCPTCSPCYATVCENSGGTASLISRFRRLC